MTSLVGRFRSGSGKRHRLDNVGGFRVASDVYVCCLNFKIVSLFVKRVTKVSSKIV